MGLYKGKTSAGKIFKPKTLKGVSKMPKAPKAKMSSTKLSTPKAVKMKSVKIKI